jgi:PAS domain S-box-containing protein
MMDQLRVPTMQRRVAVYGPTVLIAVFALVLFGALRDVRRQAQWVIASQDRVAAAARVQEHVLEAESSKRGYLLTGDEAYLGPFSRSWAAADSALAVLRALTPADADLSARLDSLAGLIAVRRAQAEELLVVRRDGGDNAISQFEAASRTTAAVDTFIAEFQADQRATLAARQEHAAGRLTAMLTYVLLAGAAAGLLALLTNLLIARNVTELEDARRNLRLALDSAGLGLWQLDLEAQHAWWDARTREILGRPGEGFVPAAEAAAVVHPGDRAAAAAEWDRAARPGSTGSYRIEKRVVRGDGEIRWTLWTAVLRHAADGTPLRLVGTVQDVTETHESRQRLAESEERFRRMTEAMPQIVWAAGADGVVDFYNARWREFTGTMQESGLGDGWRSIVHPDHLQATAEGWSHAVSTGSTYEIEHLIRRTDGEYRWMLSRAVPLRDDHGSVMRWFGTATDIHDQKQAEAELRTARDAAEGASRAKSQFLAVISHELRTPLTAVIGFADLLESGALGPLADRQRDAVRRIAASSWGLVSIIDEILTFSRTEAGRELVRPQVLDVVDVAGGVVDLLKPQAALRGLTLSFAADAPSISLLSDAGKIRQILTNLLGNAVKFTEAGTVRVEVSRAADDTAEVTVRDTGPGIPAHQLDLIFEPFTQGDQSNTREKGGTGLGLAVSRRLARLLGGDVTVESEPGSGSVFTLRLPSLLLVPQSHAISTSEPAPA